MSLAGRLNSATWRFPLFLKLTPTGSYHIWPHQRQHVHNSLEKPQVANFQKTCSQCADDIVCSGCGQLMDIQRWGKITENPWFAFPNHQMEYAVDLRKLKEDYHRIMRSLHPDLREDSELANELSALIQGAYDTLLNPVKRAVKLFELLFKQPVSAENSNIDDGEFMMDLLTAQDKLDDCATSEDYRALKKEWQTAKSSNLTLVADLFKAPQETPLRNAIHKLVAIDKFLTALDERTISAGFEASN